MVRAKEYLVFDLASCRRAGSRTMPPAAPGKRPENLVAHVDGVGRVLHTREHREQRRVETRRHVDQKLIDLLLGHDELLVEVGRLAEARSCRSSRRRPIPCRSRRTQGPGNATVTHGSVSLVQGTCTYCGPAGGGSGGIAVGARGARPSSRPSTSRRAAARDPATRRRR